MRTREFLVLLARIQALTVGIVLVLQAMGVFLDFRAIMGALLIAIAAFLPKGGVTL